MGLNPNTLPGWSSEQMHSYLMGLEASITQRNGRRPPWEVADLQQLDDAMLRVIDAAESTRQVVGKLMAVKSR